MRRVGVDGSAIRADTASNVCCEIVMLRRAREGKGKRRKERKIKPTIPFPISFIQKILFLCMVTS